MGRITEIRELCQELMPRDNIDTIICKEVVELLLPPQTQNRPLRWFPRISVRHPNDNLTSDHIVHAIRLSAKISEEKGIDPHTHEACTYTLMTFMLTEQDAQEYAKNTPVPKFSDIFRADFVKGRYRFVGSPRSTFNNETLVVILGHPDHFKSVVNRRGETTIYPIGKPDHEWVCDSLAARRELARRLVHKDLDRALEIAYGGDWSTIGHKSKKKLRGLSSKFHRLPKLKAYGIEEELLDQMGMLGELTKLIINSEKQSKALVALIDKAGGGGAFVEQLEKDLFNNVPLCAVSYAQDKNDTVRNLALCALGGTGETNGK